MKKITKIIMGTNGKDTVNLFGHTDAGHGWIACKRKLLHELGIADKITQYSYQKGKSVYLEEDCDATTLIDALETQNYGYKIVESSSWKNSSPIRNYDRYLKE